MEARFFTAASAIQWRPRDCALKVTTLNPGQGSRNRMLVRASSRNDEPCPAVDRWNKAGRVFLTATTVFLASSTLAFHGFARAEDSNAFVPPRPATSRRMKVSSAARQKQDYQDMVEVLVKRLEEEPNNVMAYKALLQLHLDQCEFKEAIKVLDKLISLEPEELEFVYARARAYDMIGDVESARNEFERLVKAKPLSAKLLQGLVFCMQKNGENKETVLQRVDAAVQNAVQQNDSKAARNFKMLRGQILTVQKNLTEALSQYDELIKEDPDDFRPYICEGLLHESLGNSEEAKKNFQMYSKLCPQTFPKRKYLDELLLRGKIRAQQEQDEKEGKGVVRMEQPRAF